MKNLVYLAGPITGLTFGEATDWRSEVQRSLPPHIETLSPLRGKQYLEERSSKDGAILDAYDAYPLSSSRGINTRDHWDATRCDAILVYLLGAQKVSIGTVMEIAWAHTRQIPCVLVMEDEGNVHEHSMIRESVGFRVNSLAKGIEVLTALLSTDQQLQQLQQQATEGLNDALLRHLAEKMQHADFHRYKQLELELPPTPTPIHPSSVKEAESSPLDLFKDTGETNAEQIIREFQERRALQLDAQDKKDLETYRRIALKKYPPNK